MAAWAERDKIGQVVGGFPIDAACASVCPPGQLSTMVAMDRPTLSPSDLFANSTALLTRVIVSLKCLESLRRPIRTVTKFFN